MESTVLSLLFQFFIQPLLDISIILLPFLIFGIIIRFLKGRIDDILINDMGGRAPYYIFAFAGTPVHEASHLISAFIFRHKIKRFSLFSPDETGRLGFVEHAYDPQSLYQRVGCFFVGIAPIIGGCLVLFCLTRLFLPRFSFPAAALVSPGLLHLKDAHGFWMLVKALFRDIGHVAVAIAANPPPLNWRTFVYSYLALAIGSHMFPSLADFKGMVPGLLTLYFLICLFDFWLRIIHVDTQALLAGYVGAAGVGVSFMIFVVLLLASSLIVLFLLKLLLGLFLRRNG